MELPIWDGISDMNEKTPPADMANGVLHNKNLPVFSYWFYTQEDTCLLSKTERISVSILLRMKSLCSMSLSSIASRTTSIVLVGSSNIWKKHWPKTKDNLHLDEMKNLNIKALTYEMVVELYGKKSKGDIEKYLDQLIKDLYARKWYEQPPRPKRLGTTSVQPISAVGRDSSHWPQHVSDLLLTEGPLGKKTRIRGETNWVYGEVPPTIRVAHPMHLAKIIAGTLF